MKRRIYIEGVPKMQTGGTSGREVPTRYYMPPLPPLDQNFINQANLPAPQYIRDYDKVREQARQMPWRDKIRSGLDYVQKKLQQYGPTGDLASVAAGFISAPTQMAVDATDPKLSKSNRLLAAGMLAFPEFSEDGQFLKNKAEADAYQMAQNGNNLSKFNIDQLKTNDLIQRDIDNAVDLYKNHKLLGKSDESFLEENSPLYDPDAFTLYGPNKLLQRFNPEWRKFMDMEQFKFQQNSIGRRMLNDDGGTSFIRTRGRDNGSYNNFKHHGNYFDTDGKNYFLNGESVDPSYYNLAAKEAGLFPATVPANYPQDFKTVTKKSEVFTPDFHYNKNKYGGNINSNNMGRKILIEGLPEMKSGGWIKNAVNPAHKGFCTPMTKSTCTPRRKAFAMTMKKHHGFHKEYGGEVTQAGNMVHDDELYAMGGSFHPLAKFMQDGGPGGASMNLPANNDGTQNAWTPQASNYNPSADPNNPVNNPGPMPQQGGYAASQGPVWDNTGVTDQQQQQGPTTDGPVNNNRQRGAGWGYVGAGLATLGAGMGIASYLSDRRDQRNLRNKNFNDRMTSNAFAAQNQPGGMGDYDQYGSFRPNQNTPSRAGMYYPKMGAYGGHYAMGGMYHPGQELEMSDAEIARLRGMGYKIEEI